MSLSIKLGYVDVAHSPINADTFYLTKEFQEFIKGDKEIILYVPASKEYILFYVSNGENLLDEDIEDGMNNSFYIRCLRVNEQNCFVEEDGAEMVFNDEQEDYFTNVKRLCEECLMMIGCFGCIDYRIVGFTHRDSEI